jgi:hypothetical protein
LLVQAIDTLRRDCLKAKPRPAKPSIIITQVDGSGTVVPVSENAAKLPLHKSKTHFVEHADQRARKHVAPSHAFGVDRPLWRQRRRRLARDLAPCG